MTPGPSIGGPGVFGAMGYRYAEGMTRTPLQARARLRFCSRCNRDAPSDASLCPDCGDPLANRGFCPVCLDTWRLSEGSPCPKHEIPLAASPPDPTPADSDAGGMDWVTVATYNLPGAVEPRRLRLEAEGIPTFLDGSRMGDNAVYAVATGGIKLQVPRALAADARVLLAQSWALPASDDDLDEAWDDLAPEASAVGSAMSLPVLLMPLAIVLALLIYLVFRRS